MSESEYRAPNGHLIAPIPGSEIHQITPANARNLAALRWEKYRQAAVTATVEEGRSFDPAVKGGASAWGRLVAKQYTALYDSDKPRGDDLVQIGRVLGAVPNALDVRQAEQQQSGAAPATVPASVALALVELLRQVTGRQVIDGTVTDADVE